MSKHQWKLGDKCRHCNQKLVIMHGKMKRGKKWYYDPYYICPSCKATYFNKDDIVYPGIKEKKERRVKEETPNNRRFRKSVMEFYRGLNTKHKQEFEDEVEALKELFV